MTNFVNAIRTADTLLEVARFIREARTASRRSGERSRPYPSTPAAADGLKQLFPDAVRSTT